MNGSIVRLLIVLLSIGCCGFSGCITCHRFVLWNHSDHALRVVYTIPPSYFDPQRHYHRIQDTLSLSERADTVQPGERRMLLELRTNGFRIYEGDTLPMRIFIGDSPIYQQDTLSTDLWEIRSRSESLGLSTAVSYTLHVFNASTRQPGW